MNYQNYIDTPQGAGVNSNSRQAPSPSQGMNHNNGVNGNAVGLPGIMAGLPTPAGHQDDLNYMYSLVEELSKALEEQRAMTSRIIEATGKVRQVAIEKNLTNDEILA